ncbi:hypothetical protein QL285_042802 [Trifolium repens]|nr:hypothetical protein QL285_042802 [Trifolium repens]
MAPKSKEGPRMGDESPPNGEEIPTGWSVKSEVENDGTIIKTYYCPDTGQEFYTYPTLIRYVDYAKKNKIGIYTPALFKSIRKQKMDALKKHNPIGHRKTTAALSIPGRPRLPNSDSLAADQHDDSKPSRSCKSTDEDVEDYVPEQDADVSTNMPIDEADKL